MLLLFLLVHQCLPARDKKLLRELKMHEAKKCAAPVAEYRVSRGWRCLLTASHLVN